MSAEVLRRAAALMRERAEYANEGPWVVKRQPHNSQYAIEATPENSTAFGLGGDFVFLDAFHIASWHPAVALAVADWLDMTAGQVANYGPNMDSPWTKPHEQMALAVARAYLGETP